MKNTLWELSPAAALLVGLWSIPNNIFISIVCAIWIGYYYGREL